MKRFAILYALVFFVSSCSDNKPSSNEKEIEEVIEVAEVKPVYPSEPKFDAIASFLAGERSDDQSELSGLEGTAEFKSFCSSMDQLWAETNEKLPVIKDWTSTEMKDVNETGGTLFYPFSGADFLHADLF